jgi:hypothetical protein
LKFAQRIRRERPDVTREDLAEKIIEKIDEMKNTQLTLDWAAKNITKWTKSGELVRRKPKPHAKK